MKLYRYWVQEVREVLVGGEMQKITCYGGSNESVEQARSRALEKIGRVERKIGGSRQEFADYEAEIREEIVESLDEHNAVTRNRYGALVLNSESLVFVDIDEPEYSLFEFLFGRKLENEAKKARILAMIEKKAAKASYYGFSFRIYETHSGIRLMIPGRRMDPRSGEMKRLFRDFHADRLYGTLCRKQNCYRARLTPKPHRMKMKSMRVGYPRTEEEQGNVEAWLKGYEAASENFSVCRLWKTIGRSADDPIAAYHDRMTGVERDLGLA